MATSVARVNPEILIWARERAELSLEVLSRRAGLPKNVERLSKWEDGTLLPTFNQAQAFAKATHIPFGYLFLPSPPVNEDELPIPDLRTVGSEPLGKPSAELIEIVRKALVRQAWYREYLARNGESKNPVMGRLSFDHTVDDIVSDMRNELEISIESIRGTWDQYYRDLIAKIEEKNILVMRSGIVGNNTRRTLSPKEFRGFAITDEYSPVIFVNSADAPEARLFTLIHELAHIWLGLSGVSDVKPSTHRNEEKKCNAVAAEFLVPNHMFLDLWEHTLERWDENLPKIASKFHVSQWVIARKALDNGLITPEQYGAYTNQIFEKFKNKKSSSGNFYQTLIGKYSKKLSLAVVSETLSGRTLYRDAASLLGIQPVKIKKYAKELGI